MEQSIDYLGLTTDSNSADTAVTSDINFMCNQAADGQFVNGTITEISTWTDQLTLAEVEELYNDGKALDALTHSNLTNLTAYWRNNGLATWTNLLTGSNGGSPSPTSATETMLITAGADASRDSQGFIMNRQRATNSLNIPTQAEDDPNPDDLASSSYVEVGAVINDDVFSISLWYRPFRIDETSHLVQCRDVADEGWIVQVDASANIKFKIGDGTDTVTLDSGANAVAGTWHHILVTYAGGAGAIKMYVDGVYKNTASATDVGNMSSVSSKMRIGARSFTSPINGAQGAIDDVLYYTDVLSDGGISDEATAKGEVARIYNAGKRSHR